MTSTMIVQLLGFAAFFVLFVAVGYFLMMLFDFGGWAGLREAFAIVRLVDSAHLPIESVRCIRSMDGRRMVRIEMGLPVDELAIYLPALRADLLRDVYLAHVKGRGVLSIPLVSNSAARWTR